MPKFRTITGQFAGYLPDSADDDISPDRAPMTGRVTFTPHYSGGIIAFPSLVPPEFARPEPIQARIVDGFVVVEVAHGTGDEVASVMQPLSLMVTVDDEATQVWTWQAEFFDVRITGYDGQVAIPSWTFQIPDGEGPIDLTEMRTVSKSPGIEVTKGPRGAGLQTITAVDGQLVFAYTDGQETTIPVPDAVQGPPGVDGAIGPEGPQGPQGEPGTIPDLMVHNIVDASAVGKELVKSASQTAARDTLGLQAGATATTGLASELNNGVSNNPRVWTPANLANYVAGQTAHLATESAAASYADTAATKVSTDPALVNNVKIEAILRFREYPGETSWAQAFSYDETDGVYYIGTQDDTLYKIQRVNASTGSKIDQKSFAIESGAFCESLPFWRNGSGDLCFMVRSGSGANHATYAVFNYTTGTLGSKILIKGTIRAGLHGKYLVTTDSWTTTVGRFFIYDWESVKAGTPALLSTVIPGNYGNIGLKNQGFQYLNGDFYLQHATVGENPTISRYHPNGAVASRTGWKLSDFADLINDHSPGTILDRENVTAEGEGLSFVGDRLLSGWTVNAGDSARLVIVSHGHASAARVPAQRVPDASQATDTVSLSGASCILSRNGAYVSVYVNGGFPAVAAGATSQIGTIPAAFRPRGTLRFWALISGQMSMLAFRADGVVEVVNTSSVNIGVVTTFSTVYDVSL